MKFSSKINLDDIKFDDRGLIPAIAQDAKTGDVLMLAYMNRQSIEKTLETGQVHYFSRSRNELWLKGETSGHFQELRTAYYDCDIDTLLLKIDQTGAACHTGERSCFYRPLFDVGDDGDEQAPAGPEILTELFDILNERKSADPETSYVASLYKKGVTKINEKIAEESGELTEAALSGDRKEIVHEFADLLFHSMTLLANEDIEMTEIYSELARRFGISGIEEKRSRKMKG